MPPEAIACYIDQMRDQLRQLLLCLLIGLLPMQGIAAIIKFECVMAHQSMMLGNKQLPVMSVQSSTAFGVAKDLKHHTLESAPVTDLTESDCGDTDTREPSRCGMCATCCLVTYAPLFGMDPTTTQESASNLVAPSFSSFVGHIPDRIERPPRPA